MAEFRFEGTLPGSKSLFNRAMIVQSYFPSVEVRGHSACDDVVYMRQGLRQLQNRQTIDCGEGGTTFRFLALRCSREPGIHTLKAHHRLFQRPQKGLISILEQLGVEVRIDENQWVLTSHGWRKPTRLFVDLSESSQYASALLLNAWDLDFDLEFTMSDQKVSESYLELTLQMLHEWGLDVQLKDEQVFVPKGQRPALKVFTVEPDLSSSFTIAAAGALCGEVVLWDFPFQSRQPDRIFLDIFDKMGVRFLLEKDILRVFQSPDLRPLQWNLSSSPDLFPVLAVLCSYAEGESRLYGAPHLAHKESDRIAKVSELLRMVGVSHQPASDGMSIQGRSHYNAVNGVFDPDHDHRMVMAATLFKLKGHQIHVQSPHVINKSFPEFWDVVGVEP